MPTRSTGSPTVTPGSDHRISRRSVLRGIGLAGAAAGSVILVSSDRSQAYQNKIQVQNPAGLRVAWTERYNGSVLESEGAEDRRGSGPVIRLTDVLPGDSGSLAIRLEPVADPDSDRTFTMTMRLDLVASKERGMTEPERKAGDGTESNSSRAEGELAEEANVTVAYDSGILGTNLLACDGSTSLGEFGTIASGPLDEVAETLEEGAVIDPPGDDGCFAVGEAACIVFEWTIPESVGNVIQTDSLRLDLSFRCEECE